MVQWLRIHQLIHIQFLIQEDPNAMGQLSLWGHNYWHHMLQLLKPMCLESVLQTLEEKSLQSETHTQQDRIDSTLRNQRKSAQQRRPSAAKKKKKF